MLKFRMFNRRRGSSIVEFAMLMPWYFFLFVGAYDFGIYSYALIATEEGVRVAALNASQNSTTAVDATTAGQFVLDSIRNLPNIGASTTTASAAPIVVTAGKIAGPDGGNAAQVTATYTSPQLIPIPGLVPGKLTITESVTMKLRGN